MNLMLKITIGLALVGSFCVTTSIADCVTNGFVIVNGISTPIVSKDCIPKGATRCLGPGDFWIPGRPYTHYMKWLVEEPSPSAA